MLDLLTVRYFILLSGNNITRFLCTYSYHFAACTLRRHLRRVWFVIKIHLASPNKPGMSTKGARKGRLIY